VAPPTPLEGIFAAVTRHTLDGANPGGWIPEEKITVHEALRGYTTAAVYAGFADGERGSLVPGKLADIAVMNRDISGIPADEIADVRVTATIAGGDVIFERE
jgi:hypothetical protein